MDFTPGEMFFYIGIAGIIIGAVIAIIVIILLSGSWKRLRRKKIEEYGDI